MASRRVRSSWGEGIEFIRWNGEGLELDRNRIQAGILDCVDFVQFGGDWVNFYGLFMLEYPNFLLKASSQMILCHFQIILTLQIEPESFRHAEEIETSRKAVSGEMARLPWTISLIRRAGTLISLASRAWLMPRGVRNSSRKISPGWIGGSFGSDRLFIRVSHS